MAPSEIGWLVSMLLWLLSYIVSRIAERHGKEELCNVFIVLQWLFVGFSWIFIGYIRNWW